MATRRPDTEDLSLLAWAAGLFEGEGCFYSAHYEKRNQTVLRVTLGMTDRDVVERFAEVMGFGRVREKTARKAHWKTMYIWEVTAASDVLRAVEALSPWLGERRKAKAAEAKVAAQGVIDRLEARERACRHGHPVTPENTLIEDGKRRCRPCRVGQKREATIRHRQKVAA